MKERQNAGISLKKGALGSQIGGNHYKDMKIQPIEFAMANNLNMCQANAVKYITRKKGDISKILEDRKKAIHCIEIEIQALESEAANQGFLKNSRLFSMIKGLLAGILLKINKKRIK